MTNKLLKLASALAVLIASTATAHAAPEDGLVYCLDPERQLISRREPLACRGKIIDQAAVDRIRQRRIKRIRGLLFQEDSLFPNLSRSSSGSGFFVTSAGEFLTSGHVVADCRGLTVQPMSGKAVRAEILYNDSATDLALLRVKSAGPSRTIAVFRDNPGKSTAEVSIIGYPLYARVAIKPLITTGRAIGIWRKDGTRSDLFKIKVDVRRGNSGGPVLDVNGLVIGVVTAKINTPEVFKKNRPRGAQYRRRDKPRGSAQISRAPQH